MMRRQLLKSIAALGIAIALPVAAQNAGYTELSNRVTTSDPSKIEVLEFFSYTCIHCANVNSDAKRWAAKQGQDVVFKKVPVVFDRRQEPTARLYYTLELTGDLARLDTAAFDAIHQQKQHMMSDDAVKSWVSKQGVDMKKFEAAYNSFGVNTKVQQAVTLQKTYNVSGTPSFFVNGQYRVENQHVDSYDKLFKVIDDLVAKSRQPKSRGIRG